MSSTLSPEELDQVLGRTPSCAIGVYPTPLMALPRLTQSLGRPVFLKRDDQLGPLAGGNKTRKLEFLLADALRLGARRVVTVGGLQSNHVRLTAAAARLQGLEPHLLLLGDRPAQATGNLLLDELVGAELYFIPPTRGPRFPGPFGEVDGLLRQIASEEVGDHYFIPIGGSNWLGSLGYARAAVEIDRQVVAAGLRDAWLIAAAGSGGTVAGLLAGLGLLESKVRLIGLDIGQLWTDFPEHICRNAGAVCEHLGTPLSFDPAQPFLIQGRYEGPGYGVPTEESQAAIRRLARTEGVLLDPTYTAKAFAGMLDLVSRGELGKDDPVIFLHTGGLPGLFA